MVEANGGAEGEGCWRNNGLWRLRLNIKTRKMDPMVKREEVVTVFGRSLACLAPSRPRRTKATGHRNAFVLFFVATLPE